MVCPKCKTDSAQRSHRAGLMERLAGMVGYRPYRCQKCKHRFSSRFGAPPDTASSVVQRVEREISSTRVGMRWKRKQRDLILFGAALIGFGVILYFLTRAPSMGG
jgi:hypothetical protein